MTRQTSGLRVIVTLAVSTLIAGCSAQTSPAASTSAQATASLTASPSAAAPSEAPSAFSQGRIAFQSERDGNSEIYVASAGGSLVNLTNNAALAAHLVAGRGRDCVRERPRRQIPDLRHERGWNRCPPHQRRHGQ